MRSLATPRLGAGRARLLALASLLVLATACVPAAKAGDGPAPGGFRGVVAAQGLRPSGRPQTGLPRVTLRSGSVSVEAELAIAPAEQETGLMHRTELADGAGMLFVYDSDRRMAFWMKNTLIPLSIAYIGADGVIKEIYDMEPLSLASVPSERSVRYALEVPLGWFGRVGLGPGDRLDIPEALGRR